MAQRILVVDDEDHIRNIVKINLERAGYEVTTAANGREALESVAANRPDLLVMDVMMPQVDGITALKTLKEDPGTAAIPVILLTAQDQNADVFRGWQSGADLYLTKPFQVRELLVFIKRILDSVDEENQDQPYEIIPSNPTE